MNAESFYHVCRSAASISGVREITVFGASAVVPWMAERHPEGPFWRSAEVDIDPGTQELADLVDGCIGELSGFDELFGVRAHGVMLVAFTAPGDWPSRARAFVDSQSGVRIRAPHPIDLVVAKLVRGDEKDWEFAAYCREHFGLSVASIEDGLRRAGEARPEYAAAAAQAAKLLRAKLEGAS